MIMRIAAQQSGTTLVACSLVLLGVALLSSATLRSVEDGISVLHNALDRRLAQHAAEAALHDAAMTLTMSPEPLSMIAALGPHRFGDITGETYPYGGQSQPRVPPDYVVELLTLPDVPDQASDGGAATVIYRVTARGTGRSESTTVTLQAEFVLRRCAARNDASLDSAQETEQGAGQDTAQTITQDKTQSSVQYLTQNTTQDTAQNTAQNNLQNYSVHTKANPARCVPGVRQLAWRVLPAS